MSVTNVFQIVKNQVIFFHQLHTQRNKDIILISLHRVKVQNGNFPQLSVHIFFFVYVGENITNPSLLSFFITKALYLKI
jgi:hypothetical protein